MKTMTCNKTMTHERTQVYTTAEAVSPGPSGSAGRDGPLHERAVLSASLATLLRRSLRGLDWAGLPDADRNSLERALTALGGDIPLVWLIRGQDALQDASKGGTTPGDADRLMTTGMGNGDTAKNRGTTENRDTTKAAPAASPSHWGIESSDGEAAFPGHPTPAGEGNSPDPGGPMRRESVAPDPTPGNARCVCAAGHLRDHNIRLNRPTNSLTNR